MCPCGPIWVAIGEKNNMKNVKIIISDSDFFGGLCLGDRGGARAGGLGRKRSPGRAGPGDPLSLYIYLHRGGHPIWKLEKLENYINMKSTLAINL